MSANTDDRAFVLAFDTQIRRDELSTLFRSLGWTAYLDRPDALLEAVTGSHLVLTARCDGELVGLVRVVSDGLTVAMIRDVALLPDCPSELKGRMIDACLSRLEGVRETVVVTDDDDVATHLSRKRFKDVRWLRQSQLTTWLHYEGVSLK